MKFRVPGKYATAVATLAGGAGLAQLIPLVAAPFLTRLYSPSDFAALALLTSLGAIWASVACGRLHMAVLIPASDMEARRVLSLSLTTIALGSLILFSAVALAELVDRDTTLVPVLGPWLMAVPLLGALIATHEALTAAAIRFNLTGPIAQTSITRATFSVGGQLGLGALGVPDGLLYGSTGGSFAGNLRLWTAMHKIFPSRPDTLNARDLVNRYVRFITLDTPGALLNALSTNLLVIGIGIIYTNDDLGQYSLAFRVLVLPSAVIGTAIGQVMSQRVAAARRVNDHRLSLSEFHRTTLILTVISLCCFVPLILSGKSLFALVFGEQWRYAGEIATVIAPLLIIRFVCSPLSSVFALYERQGALLVLQASLATTTVCTLVLAWATGWTLIATLVIQSILLSCIYLCSWVAGRRLLISRVSEGECRL